MLWNFRVDCFNTETKFIVKHNAKLSACSATDHALFCYKCSSQYEHCQVICRCVKSTGMVNTTQLRQVRIDTNVVMENTIALSMEVKAVVRTMGSSLWILSYIRASTSPIAFSPSMRGYIVGITIGNTFQHPVCLQCK